MRRCLELAQRAKGHTAPNPLVGAVLVHDGRIISEGWHHSHGADHAEVDCLKNVAEADIHLVRHSTMYVNLEPCAHHGLTPPCAVQLAEEQIKKVVIANTDPFEKVQGRGIGILKAAGIGVETAVKENEGLWVNRRFFCFHQQKRPYIILKWAQTADGYIAPVTRSRLQITGSAATQLVHKWRTEEAAIIVGTTTALNDNPELTARLWSGKQPIRMTPDRNLQLPRHYHIFNNSAPTWIINEHEEGVYGNIHYTQLPFDGYLLPRLLDRMHSARILSVIVEGGAKLLDSFINAGLWDEARIFTGQQALGKGIAAPLLKGGALVLKDNIENDTLQVYVHKNSAYPYVKGMEL